MISPPEIWAGVLRRLEAQLPSYALQAWVQPLTAEGDGEGIRLLCPSRFHRDRVRDRFLPLILRAAAEEAGRPVGFALAVSERRSRAADDPEPPRPSPDPPARRHRLDPKHSRPKIWR